jgi:prepilin-type N-terminal cleavage/methylation domain-containing protein
MRQRKRSGRDAGAGFTLVELIICAGIFAVVAAGLLQIFVYSLWESESAGRFTTALSAAYAKFEEVRATDFSNVTMNYTAGGIPGDTFTVPAINGRGVVTIDASNPELLVVRTVVCWQDRAGRVFGDDRNLNGVLETGEDANGNGEMDSPVALVSLVGRR